MRNVDQRDLSIISAIELDLAKARRAGRFEAVLECLDEILVHHKHTENVAVKSRCADILRAV
jgi:hypothetical protein